MHLVWFRNDLRIADNSALTKASQLEGAVAAVYVFTTEQWALHDMAECKKALLYARVQQLKNDLAKFNIPLLLISRPDYKSAQAWVSQLCIKKSVSSLHFCNEYELNEQQRDSYIVESLASTKTKIYRTDDSLIFAPGTVKKQDQTLYSVFTPFKKQWLKLLSNHIPQCVKKPHKQNEENMLLWQKLELSCDAIAPIESAIAKAWPADEESILERLRLFCREQVEDYQHNRDFPHLEATSSLSPYFSIGALTPRQALNRLVLEQGEAVFAKGSGAEVWLSELIWREFYRHLVAFYPLISKQLAVKESYRKLGWRNNPSHFKAWCEGQTGYPIVDAAMRQLNQTGWMHNRLRMITASFLVKDLQIDWRWGEKYFMQKLIDGDFAANNGGWQWSASTGHDAAPYFRIFNPTTQGERFDSKGGFIKKYCPELNDVPEKWIHKPQEYAKRYAKPLNYPDQIVDHKVARQLTLEMYKNASQ
ncbi:deoxyribodipyrimidine photo-lyase [Catenovulum sediminis]|uniref:Deoxyribodipyrimidine photo-lyase n=1 Tax=Catenovulum sediminis TaxID=1740262 RepID=A0ABV1RKV3_9ALTE